MFRTTELSSEHMKLYYEQKVQHIINSKLFQENEKEKNFRVYLAFIILFIVIHNIEREIILPYKTFLDIYLSE